MFLQTNQSENWELIIVGGKCLKNEFVRNVSRRSKVKRTSDTVHLVERKEMYSYRLCRNFDFTFSTRGFSERIG
jgi:hypothetical protein